MTDRLGRLMNLGRAERAVLLKAWLMLPIVQVSLRLLGVRRTRGLLRRITTAPSLAEGLSPEQVRSGVARAARHHLWETRCLAQSLLATSWAPGARVQIGVRRGAHGLEAHAWVEASGIPIGERTETLAGFHSLGLGSEQL